MQYSKEELLTIGKFCEIPNVDESKTRNQLKLIIDTWLDMGIERVKQIEGGNSLALAEMLINDQCEKEFLQLSRENLHLSLDSKLEKLCYCYLEKVKQNLESLPGDEAIWKKMLNHPNFVKLDVWCHKEIFYNPNFDVEKFERDMFCQMYKTFVS